MIQLFKCNKCLVEKSVEMFHKDNNRKCGVSRWCKECMHIQNKKYKKDHKNQIKTKHKEYCIKNKKSMSLSHKKWLKENKQHVRKYHSDKYKNDIQYRLKCRLRGRISGLMGKVKMGSITKQLINFIGCSLENLKIHIESQFIEGMSWDNYGIKENQWSIDHIIPCSKFDHTSIEEIKKCHNYKNLRPMWHIDNMKKSDKLEN